jgi:predicted transcriptional regulator
MTDETLLTLTSDIVSAHVSNNTVPPDELPVLITSVYASLSGLGRQPEASDETRVPAVSVRASVKSDMLTCLDCGSKMKMLKRHLSTDHGLTPAEYRSRWHLNSDYPMVAPDYAAKRKELAVKIGLGRNPTGRGKDSAAAASAVPLSVDAPTGDKKVRRKAVKAAASEGEPSND